MPNSVSTLVATAVLVLAASSGAAAQTGAVLSGVVYDRAGDPVSGVVLTIVDSTQAGTRVVVSGQNGAYFVDRLHYGREYAVEASHPRFRKSRVRATANEGEAPVHITVAPRRTRLARAALFPLRVLSFGLIGQMRDR